LFSASAMSVVPEFAPLLTFLRRVPALSPAIGSGSSTAGLWWVKFSIDIEHRLAWQVVQEFGHILNYVSTSERLPTIFKPVSPPPYMNGGPKGFLSWAIESSTPEFTPANCAEWLEGRMPSPVEDLSAWELSEE
jgi:hypothetical protein